MFKIVRNYKAFLENGPKALWNEVVSQRKQIEQIQQEITDFRYSFRDQIQSDLTALRDNLTEQTQSDITNLREELTHQVQRNVADLKRDIMEEVRSEIASLSQSLVEQVQAALANLKRDIAEQVNSEIAGLNHHLAGHMSSEAADLRQIGHLAVRKATPFQGRIRCIFLVHAIESWDAQIDIWQAMRNDNRFDPIVASINRCFPGDSEYRGEEDTSAALDRMGVPHIRLGMEPPFLGLDILRALTPDIIFRQSQWEEDVPWAFTTARLNFAKLCSVPYGMSIVAKFSPDERTEGGVSENSFDQHWHRMAWRVFCETEQTKEYFTQFRHSDPNKFVVSGYPKLARLLKAREEPEVWPIKRDDKPRFRVIWAPHWSIGTDWLGFGTFDGIFQEFLSWAKDQPDIDFVLKPHPALFKTALSQDVLEKQLLDDFLTAWNELPNCALETGPYAHLFAASDIMVTDGLSFLTEYPIFEKPLVFIDSGRHVPMNVLGDTALAASHKVRTFDEIKGAVEYYAAGGAWQYEAERETLIKILLPREKEAAAIILDEIADGITPSRMQTI